VKTAANQEINERRIGKRCAVTHDPNGAEPTIYGFAVTRPSDFSRTALRFKGIEIAARSLHADLRVRIRLTSRLIPVLEATARAFQNVVLPNSP
jgi:hypothetical protein